MLQQMLKLHSSCSPSPDMAAEWHAAAVLLMLVVGTGMTLETTAEAR
jgi:hypothetical protein